MCPEEEEADFYSQLGECDQIGDGARHCAEQKRHGLLYRLDKERLRLSRYTRRAVNSAPQQLRFDPVSDCARTSASYSSARQPIQVHRLQRMAVHLRVLKRSLPCVVCCLLFTSAVERFHLHSAQTMYGIWMIQHNDTSTCTFK